MRFTLLTNTLKGLTPTPDHNDEDDVDPMIRLVNT